MAGLDLNLNLGCSFTHDGCLTVERQEVNSKARESSSDFRKIQHRNLLRLVAWLSIDNPSLPSCGNAPRKRPSCCNFLLLLKLLVQ